MAEEILNDSFPDLKELESKVGRKTPESLVVWMKDAAHCGEGGSPDGGEDRRGSGLTDSFSDKISNLKQEMRWLRSADVRILRQLVAVHEGIEAMRWLMEERGALASRGSSLTGSLSSLVTMEEPGASMSPWRESPSPTCLHDLTETIGEDSADHPPRTSNNPSDRKGYLDMFCPESSGARSDSKYEASPSIKASSAPASSFFSANLLKSQAHAVPSQDIKTAADPIRRALQTSGKAARSDVKADTGGFSLNDQWAKTLTGHQTQEILKASENKAREEDESPPQSVLLGYDAQWCWVESQDDVTFL